MKIEKINEHQIRCTLTSADLAARQIKLSELVYGSDKTKKLFHDMMEAANAKFGFEADDIPLMIEAIPMNSGCIVLLITKVDDPEELDTRFSNFSHSALGDVGIGDDSDSGNFPDSANGLLNLLKKLKDAVRGEGLYEALGKDDAIVYEFENLDNLLGAVAAVSGGLPEINDSLYKSEDDTYLLVVMRGKAEEKAMSRLFNALSEFGIGRCYKPGPLASLLEHSEMIIRSGAIEALTAMNK